MLDLIADILFKRAENISDETIISSLLSEGKGKYEIEKAFLMIEEDVILTVKSLPYLTPLFPVTYKFGVHKIEKKVGIFYGIMNTTYEIAVKTIDKINIDRNFLFANITIIHSDEGVITIPAISPSSASKIDKMYCAVIDAQRRSIINISQD